MFLKSELIKAKHGFFTRKLNCGFGYGDSDDVVLANRQAAMEEIGGKTLVTAKQIHSDTALIVNGLGNYQADALITDKPGVTLGVMTADCVPILLEDAQKNIVAAVHSGWRGARFGVIASAVRAMQNSGATEIVAAIGPCIQQQSYEVSDEFVSNFVSESPDNEKFFIDSKRPGHKMFDLPAYVEFKLLKGGVSRIDNLNQDTFSQNDKFYSFRRKTLGDKSYGSQISVISL